MGRAERIRRVEPGRLASREVGGKKGQCRYNHDVPNQAALVVRDPPIGARADRRGGRHRLTADQSLRLMGYYGHRTVLQYLSIPVGAQFAPASSGGVIDLHRDFGGGDARFPSEADLEALAGEVEQFSQRFADNLEEWRDDLRRIARLLAGETPAADADQA